MYECNLYSISEETSVSDVLRTHLFVFLTGAIRILICIQGYLYLKPNLIQNVKTNTILVISVNSVYVDWKTFLSRLNITGPGSRVALGLVNQHKKQPL